MGKNVDSLTSTSKEVEVRETTQIEWIDAKRSPFVFAGTDGNWTITIAGAACCEKKFKTIKDAQAHVDAKGWDLILIATTIYNEKIQQIKAMKENE